jgi:hypothetical protein
MDRQYAIRLVIFEYLLPEQRRIRVSVLKKCMCTGITKKEHNQRLFMLRLLLLSDRLLESQGFSTTFYLPITTKHTNMTPVVDALIDGNGPYHWLGGANPFYGVCLMMDLGVPYPP